MNVEWIPLGADVEQSGSLISPVVSNFLDDMLCHDVTEQIRRNCSIRMIDKIMTESPVYYPCIPHWITKTSFSMYKCFYNVLSNRKIMKSDEPVRKSIREMILDDHSSSLYSHSQVIATNDHYILWGTNHSTCLNGVFLTVFDLTGKQIGEPSLIPRSDTMIQKITITNSVLISLDEQILVVSYNVPDISSDTKSFSDIYIRDGNFWKFKESTNFCCFDMHCLDMHHYSLYYYVSGSQYELKCRCYSIETGFSTKVKDYSLQIPGIYPSGIYGDWLISEDIIMIEKSPPIYYYLTNLCYPEYHLRFIKTKNTSMCAHDQCILYTKYCKSSKFTEISVYEL